MANVGSALAMGCDGSDEICRSVPVPIRASAGCVHFFSNSPYHYVGDDDVEPRVSLVFCGINMPDLKASPNGSDQQELQLRSQQFKRSNPELDQLVDSVFNHTRIPDKF